MNEDKVKEILEHHSFIENGWNVIPTREHDEIAHQISQLIEKPKLKLPKEYTPDPEATDDIKAYHQGRYSAIVETRILNPHLEVE